MNAQEARTHHARSIRNLKEIKQSRLCGCFNCERIYSSAIVDRFLKEGTALCPICGIDSVIGNRHCDVTKEMLKELHQIYFEPEITNR